MVASFRKMRLCRTAQAAGFLAMLFLGSVAVGVGVGVARAAPEVRLPPGTRTTAPGAHVSGRGLRETTRFLAQQLARRGIAHAQIGPYRVRGVEITRFVSQTSSTSWLAIHVIRTGGTTQIYVVPRPSP